MMTKPEAITMQLGGVTDAASRKAATQLLRSQKGVRSAVVDNRAVAAVTYRADQTTVDTLTKALAQAGYPVI